MAAEWILAVCAVLGLLGVCVKQYTDLKSDVAALRVEVSGMAAQVGKLIEQTQRTQSLAIAMLGKTHPLVREMTGVPD